MKSNICKLTLSLIVIFFFNSFSLADLDTDILLLKKEKLYKKIKQIRDELMNEEHNNEQVSGSHRNLNQVLVTLVDEYDDKPTESTILTISDGPVYDFGRLTPIVDKQHTFLLFVSGREPIANIVVNSLSAPFQFASSRPHGGKFPGVGGTCDPNYIAADCTFVLSTRARQRGEFNDIIRITYTQNGQVKTAERKIRAMY